MCFHVTPLFKKALSHCHGSQLNCFSPVWIQVTPFVRNRLTFGWFFTSVDSNMSFQGISLSESFITLNNLSMFFLLHVSWYVTSTLYSEERPFHNTYT
jgi:hypothetical protein